MLVTLEALDLEPAEVPENIEIQRVGDEIPVVQVEFDQTPNKWDTTLSDLLVFVQEEDIVYYTAMVTPFDLFAQTPEEDALIRQLAQRV